ncbi:hypothetical protein AB834_05350 [PVC group bacterium (ex Bugula neritina AB1)]|nr:hypothetical protein AB834_05350 [PVC group bacterium (ex Bugula neritina AB1)]
MSNLYKFQRKQLVQTNSNDIFDFFSNPLNLYQLTPPQYYLEIKNQHPVKLHKNLEIVFKVKISRIPLTWVSEIIDWNPKQKSFTEKQIKGPFKHWVHKHTIHEVNKNMTEIIDNIEYSLPYGPLSEIIHRRFLKKHLQYMFTYRFQRITEIFKPFSPPRFASQRNFSKNNSSSVKR